MSFLFILEKSLKIDYGFFFQGKKPKYVPPGVVKAISVDTVTSSSGAPPQLSVDVPLLQDVERTKTKPPKDAHLPVDVLLLIVKNCEFLACYMELKNPYRCWLDGLRYVYFGDAGKTGNQEEKVKVALISCYEVPGGLLVSMMNAVPVLRPKAVISVGICSGLKPDESNLGDVVISEKVRDQSSGMGGYVSRRFCSLIKNTDFDWIPPLMNPESGPEINIHRDGDFVSGPVLVRAGLRREQPTASFPQATAIDLEGQSELVS